MTTQELIITIVSSVVLGGGGTLGVWALASRWAARRMSLADRRSEIEIAGEEAEQKARLAILEEQRKTIAGVATMQERIADAVERSVADRAAADARDAAWQEAVASHLAHIGAWLERIERTQGIGKDTPLRETPPPPEPIPRRPTASAPGVATSPQKQ